LIVTLASFETVVNADDKRFRRIPPAVIWAPSEVYSRWPGSDPEETLRLPGLGDARRNGGADGRSERKLLSTR
jgi:hypothetical protein